MIDVLQEIERRLNLFHWSHYELAKRAGIPESTLSSMFQKRRLPTLHTLERICNAFGVPIEQFLLGNQPPDQELSDEKLKWLEMYDKLYPDEQKAILQVIDQFKKAQSADETNPADKADNKS